MSEIVRAAGKLSLEHFGRLQADDIRFKSEVDLVTVADCQVEKFLATELAEAFPGIPFIGEESADRDWRSCDSCFIADPIDGTTNFVHSVPYYAVSVALKHDGRLQAGAVYLPCFDALYRAARGHGAYCNDQRIQVSGTDTLVGALATTGFACIRERMAHNNLGYFPGIVEQLRGVRITGAAAVDCCYVADGRFDLYWELNLKPWDAAAGTVIIEEAGGRVTTLDGVPEFDVTRGFVATNGLLHDQFTALAQEQEAAT